MNTCFLKLLSLLHLHLTKHLVEYVDLPLTLKIKLNKLTSGLLKNDPTAPPSLKVKLKFYKRHFPNVSQSPF